MTNTTKDAFPDNSDNFGNCGTDFYVAVPRLTEGLHEITVRMVVYSCEVIPVPFSIINATGDIVFSSITSSSYLMHAGIDVFLTLNDIVNDNSYAERHKGLYVRSETGYPISVIVQAWTNYYFLDPKHGLHSRHYVALHSPPWLWQEYEYWTMGAGNHYPGMDNWGILLVVGVYNDTNITVTPSQDISFPIDPQDPVSTTITVLAGTSHSFTLHRLQTLLVGRAQIDPSGSHVISNKPLTVISGNQCAHGTGDFSQQCNAVYMQVPPTAVLGTKFIVPVFAARTVPHNLKVLAAYSNTKVTHTCGTVTVSTFMVNAGDIYTYTASVACYVTTSQPVVICYFVRGYPNMIFSYPYGAACLFYVPPVDHYITKRAAVNDLGYPNHNTYGVVIQLAENVKKGGFMIHTINVMNISMWTAISDHTGATIAYTFHQFFPTTSTSLNNVYQIRQFNHMLPFLAINFGESARSQFGYTPGVKLRPIKYGKLYIMYNTS